MPTQSFSEFMSSPSPNPAPAQSFTAFMGGRQTPAVPPPQVQPETVQPPSQVQPPAPPVQYSGGLIDPASAVWHATNNAAVLANIIQARQQMAQNPPPVPAAPLAYDLQTDQQKLSASNAPTWRNPRTGRSYPVQDPGKERGPLSVLDNPITGVQHVAEGVSQMAEPGLREKAGGLHKVIGGTLEAATPLMVGAGAVAPLATAATLATGTAAQMGTEAALKKIGIPEEYAQFAGDLVGLFAAAKTPKTIAALKAKYEPVLKARFEKANPTAPEPAANSTGGEPYRPAAAAPPTPPAPASPAAAEVRKPKVPGEFIRRTDERDGRFLTHTGVAPGIGVYKVPVSEIDAHDLWGDAEKMRDAESYAGMFRAGREPPALSGSFDEQTGRVALDDGHRRLAAAKMAGETHLPVAIPGYENPAQRATIESPGVSPLGANGQQPAATPAAVDTGAARPLDPGGTGGGQRLHGEPPSGKGPHVGEATDVLIPGEERSIPARYEVRELSDIQPSHNGQTFLPNPKYQGHNERDYTKPENQGRVIDQSSEEKFEPRYHITDNPDMVNGPALIDEDGNAIGGNDRTMHLQRVYGRDARGAAGYRALLEKKAAQFGIDPEAVRGMRQPVLVRVATPGGLEALPGGSKWAVRKTNIVGTAALSASERAAADAGQMSPEMMTHIAGAIEDAGPDATLNDALTGRSGTVIVNRLIAEGFFNEQERPALMDGKTGVLTQTAKDRISKALLGKFFRDSDRIARTPASIRNKLERVAAPLAKVAADPEWDISPDVREAVDLIEYAGAHGIRNLGDVVSQTSLFGESPGWSDGAVKLAEMLRDGKPNDVVGAFRKYVNSKEPNMFGESTPAEAFRGAFGAEKPVQGKPGESSPGDNNPPDKPAAPPPAISASSSAAPVASEPKPADKPADKPQDRGPVTLGSGLGAFEPFLRESIEDMKALKATRDAALEELERSKITPGEKDWGGRVRHFFTATRDLWGARANQGIARVRKLTYQYRNRRTGVDSTAEAMAIAREFRGNVDELRSILGGYHPDLGRLSQSDPKAYDRVMPRILALRPVIERALAFIDTQHGGHMDPDMKAVDQFYTNMAEMTGIEGRRVGVHHSLWNPETYVPHVLNPKGEGQLPGLRKAVGSAMGKIGKHFGFEQERTYETLLHAVMNDVIPRTMNIHDAFTIQQDHFARARATRLLEDQIRDTGVGVYAVKGPEGYVKLAPDNKEFEHDVPYLTGEVDEAGQPKMDIAEKRLWVKPFIADALKAITAPDYTAVIKGKDVMRGFQAATKAAQLGLSLFHATTENYMALANMGPTGWVKALRADRDSAGFLEGERRLIRAGGTTSIQGNTVEAYKAMQPGTIPSYQDIWRKAPAVRQMDEAAHAISDFTFNNMQRRFKVTDFMLHRAAWMADHPNAMQGELLEAERGMAKEVNAIYGGLHWENIGINKATVEISRAVMLAPDWTISNIFNVKYAFEKGPGGSMARMFWIRTLVGGVVATQAASLMFSRGQYSQRRLSFTPREIIRALTMVYMGKDVNGEDIYQNIFFKGAPGDAVNFVNNVFEYGLIEGPVRTIAGKGAPVVRTGLELAQNQGYMGGKIAPKGMNPLASTARAAWAITKGLSPLPFSFANQIDMLFGPEHHKYTLPEHLTTLFSGNPPSHVAPEGTHMTKYGLRPNAPREENSVLDQAETGRIYRSRSR
jgi:hypothetical protein